MKVNISELEKITILLLSKLKESKGNEIELNNDFYWDIDEKELYNPYKDPKDIALGQLSSDLEDIQRLSESGDEAIPYHMTKLSSILKALSIENPIAF